MRTFLTLIANLAAQHDTSRPQPPTSAYRYSRQSDGTYHEERI